MKTPLSNVYFIPALLLCLHVVFAVSGFYFYATFQADLDSRTAEYNAMKPRLRQIDETQLNKDLVLEVMSDNQEDYEVLMALFRSLGLIGLGMSCLSIASLINIYKSRVVPK